MNALNLPAEVMAIVLSYATDAPERVFREHFDEFKETRDYAGFDFMLTVCGFGARAPDTYERWLAFLETSQPLAPHTAEFIEFCWRARRVLWLRPGGWGLNFCLVQNNELAIDYRRYAEFCAMSAAWPRRPALVLSVSSHEFKAFVSLYDRDIAWGEVDVKAVTVHCTARAESRAKRMILDRKRPLARKIPELRIYAPSVDAATLLAIKQAGEQFALTVTMI